MMRIFVLYISLLVAGLAFAVDVTPTPSADAPSVETPAVADDTDDATTTEADAETETETAAEPAEKPGWQLANWRVDGRVDYQLMRMEEPENTTTAGQLMAGELETTATIANSERDVLDLAVQWPYATQMNGVDGRGKEMHFGNAYGIYKLGLGKPNVRFGQFVAPFGNLTYYETHTRPLQSLYPQSLGVRIDRGVSVEGFAGEYDYWVAAMGGNGARADNNTSPVVLGRVGRRMDLSNGGILTVGASALYGTEMPRFSTLVDPVMGHALEHMGDGAMEMPATLDFTDKTRVALDAEYSLGPHLVRAELVGGRDGDGSVNGQFLQYNRALNERQELTGQLARWEQPGGTRLRLGASFGQKVGEYNTIRLSAERSLGHTPMLDRNETVFSLQFQREFPGLAGG